jgi:hypothetical protein
MQRITGTPNEKKQLTHKIVNFLADNPSSEMMEQK